MSYNQYNAYNPYLPQYSNNTNYNQTIMLQALRSVIDKGMPLMTDDLTETMLSTWLEFSKEMLKIATKDVNTTIYINYLQVLLTVHSTKLTPYQKLYHCLQYLLEIMKTI